MYPTIGFHFSIVRSTSAKIFIYNVLVSTLPRNSPEIDVLTIPSKDDWVRGVLYAIAVGAPFLFEPWITSEISVYIALGAMFTLRLDPRSHVKSQTLAMMGGMLLIMTAGMLGKLVVGHQNFGLMALVIISFFAGQPQQKLKYFSLLGKLVAAAFVLQEIGGSAQGNRMS